MLQFLNALGSCGRRWQLALLHLARLWAVLSLLRSRFSLLPPFLRRWRIAQPLVPVSTRKEVVILRDQRRGAWAAIGTGRTAFALTFRTGTSAALRVTLALTRSHSPKVNLALALSRNLPMLRAIIASAIIASPSSNGRGRAAASSSLG